MNAEITKMKKMLRYFYLKGDNGILNDFLLVSNVDSKYRTRKEISRFSR